MRFCVLAFAVLLLAFAIPIDAQETSSAPVLREREPTLEQLTAYLWYYVSPSDYPGYRRVPYMRWDWYPDQPPMQYVDLNGDGELDLVTGGYLQVAAMIWLGDRYSLPFQIFKWGSPGNPFSKVSLEDWTNDGNPEVMFDYRMAHSGSDIGGDIWTKYVIHCGPEYCYEAWHGEIADYFYVGLYFDGMKFRRAELNHTISSDGLPIIEKTTTEFVVQCGYACIMQYDSEPNPPHTNFRVGGTSFERYVWDGTTFALVEESLLAEPYNMPISNRFLQTHGTDIAQLSVEPVEIMMGRFAQCQIVINRIMVGNSFLCSVRNIEWQDITGDAEAEVVVTALAGGEYGTHEGEKHCFHQRLLAFQKQDDSFVQIANITGCVVQSNMYGLRLENIDDDDALEIIAASNFLTIVNESGECIAGFCWYELNDQDEIYDWNGEQYEYARTIPRVVTADG
jgi:hypothetical protein